MEQLISDIGEIRTEKIYYSPLKFSDYEIKEYAFDGNSQEYIVSKGARQYPPAASTDFCLTFEDIRNYAISFDDTAVLQSALSLGRKLMKQNGNRLSSLGDHEKHLLLGFTRKFGLPDDAIGKLYNDYLMKCASREYKRAISKSDYTPTLSAVPMSPSKCGLPVREMALKLQDLYIRWERMDKLIDNDSKCRDNYDDLLLSTYSCAFSLETRCFYSQKGHERGKIRSVLFAPTLFDLMEYQLSVAMSSGTHVRKCANPHCTNMIVGGRTDKRTCSNACRQALKRYTDGGCN